jgi:hypothetical protein
MEAMACYVPLMGDAVEVQAVGEAEEWTYAVVEEFKSGLSWCVYDPQTKPRGSSTPALCGRPPSPSATTNPSVARASCLGPSPGGKKFVTTFIITLGPPPRPTEGSV